MRFVVVSNDKTLSLNHNFFLKGISRLRGTTLYELFHTYQQRGLNWYDSKQRSIKDILSAFKVNKITNSMTNETKIKYEKVYHCIPKIEIDLLFFKEFERNLSLI